MPRCADHVTIAKYPHAGLPLAPHALIPVLQTPVPDTIAAHLPLEMRKLSLCDADATWWGLIDSETCIAIAEAVVAEVRRHFRSLPATVLEYSLPDVATLPPGMRLLLEQRTFNALQRSGMLQRWCHGGCLTVADLLTTQPSLGSKSLVDLLATLEHATSPALMSATHEDLDARLRETAVLLLDSAASRDVTFEDPRLGIPSYLQPLSSGDRLARTSMEDYALSMLKAQRSLDDYPPSLLLHLQRVADALRVYPTQTLETELAELAGLSTSSRNAEMYCACCGWDGKGARSLRRVASEYGVSYELVRQAKVEIDDRLNKRTTFAPVLDRTIDLVTASAPWVADAISERVRVSGLTESRFDLTGLVTAAEVLGRVIPWTIEKWGDTTNVVLSEEQRVADKIRRMCEQLTARRGLVRIAELKDLLGDMSLSALLEALNRDPRTHWLGESGDMLWYEGSPRDPLASLVYRTLAACGPLPPCEIRDGIKRTGRLHGEVPAGPLISLLGRLLPDIDVKGFEDMSLREGTSRSNYLSPNECMIVAVLEQHDRVLGRQQLEDICTTTGMHRATLRVYLDSSPFIVDLGQSICALRGPRPDLTPLRSSLARGMSF